MDSMVETQACSLFSAPDFHISSFLEDFQDKNSHLFPSTDLSFDQTETDNSLQCGSKRKRDCLYESFSEWDEELLSADSLEQPTLDVLSSGNIANTTEPIEQEINSHIDKKQKLGILDEELQIFEADACSSSPPFHAIEFDLESIPIQPNPNEITNLTPTKPEQDFHGGTVPRGVNALHVISQLDDSVRSSISQSLLRIADKFESGKIPVSSKQCGSIEEQISNAQDYLTMQMLLQIPIPSAHAPLIKSDQFYSVSSGAIPFIMNGSFAVTDPSIPKYIDENDFSAYKQSLAAKSFYSKNVIYPAQPKFLPGQGFGPTTLIPTQNVYTHPNLHATTL